MASNNPELFQAFFNKGAFRGTCPACMDAHDFPPSEFPPGTKTIPYTCPCGRSYHVIPLGLRAGMRKAVNLPGILSGKPGKSLMKLPCQVRDLSTNGIGITVDPTSAEMAETLQLRVKLDDPRKTALLLPCTVRRKQKASGKLLLGLQFKQLDLDSQTALARYLSQ
jgi:hypothetical protein